MNYKIEDERLGSPTLKLDGEQHNSNMDRAASIITKFTGINNDKIKYFLESFGLKAILNNPSIMCTNQDEIKMLNELKEILEGVEYYGTNTNGSVRIW